MSERVQMKEGQIGNASASTASASASSAIDDAESAVIVENGLKIVESLKYIESNVDEIRLYRKSVSNETIPLLCDLIKKKKLNLKVLRLTKSDITNNAIKVLAENLVLPKGLKYLNLEKNKNLDDECIPHLLVMIDKLKIERLAVNQTSIRSKTKLAIPLIRSMLKNGELCKELTQAKSTTIKEIDLSDNNISSKGAILLFDSLRKSQIVVKTIKLLGNSITDECMEPLAHLLNNNKLTEFVDIGKNRISDVGFANFSKHLKEKTNLKNLNLSQNSGIGEVSFVILLDLFENRRVELVNVRYCQMKASTGFWRLQHQILENNITNIDLHSGELINLMMTRVSSIIRNLNLSSLKEIDISQNHISADGALSLFDSLKGANALTTINLDQNPLDDASMTGLANLIKNLPQLCSLSISNTQITDVGVEIIAAKLLGSKSIMRLILMENQRLTARSVQIMLKLIETTSIDCAFHYLTTVPTQKRLILPLVKNLLKNKRDQLMMNHHYLHHYDPLDASSTLQNITDKIMLNICEAIKEHAPTSLKSISLSGNRITSESAKVFFEILPDCCQELTYLNLSENTIGDDSMEALGKYLQYDQKLESLYISKTLITDKGMEQFLPLLFGNITLKSLNISSNVGITGESVNLLAQTIKATALINIYLWNCGIAYGSQATLNELLKLRLESRDLPIKSNTKSAAKISPSYLSS